MQGSAHLLGGGPKGVGGARLAAQQRVDDGAFAGAGQPQQHDGAGERQVRLRARGRLRRQFQSQSLPAPSRPSSITAQVNGRSEWLA
jgi:hypothetical protein